jgi:hypothetical protein
MSKNAYADVVNSAKVMLSGLKANSDKLARRGFDNTALTEFEGLYQKAQTLDNEQESLKAKLKTKTAELDTTLDDLSAKMSEAKKLVKIDIPKESWKEFGIADSR